MAYFPALAFGLAIFWAIRRGFISGPKIPVFLILLVFAGSLFSSLTVPYMIDDEDHLYNLAFALRHDTVVPWLMAAHNEHVVPLIKLIYLAAYQFFGLNPQPFHLAVLIVSLGTVILIYHLTLAFTGSGMAALVGAAIMAGTNLFDEAIFIGTNSHIIFCLFLFLLLFYALYQYALSPRRHWSVVALVATLCLPSTFALGLTSIFWVLLFERLCLSPEGRRNTGKIRLLLGFAWVITLVPYLGAMNSIIHAPHYHDIGGRSALDVASVPVALLALLKHVIVVLIPGLMTLPYLSFGLFFLCAAIAVSEPQKIGWKKIVFVVTFGLVHTFIIFVFRSAWGEKALMAPRFFVFLSAMMALGYPLFLEPFLKKKIDLRQAVTPALICGLCVFMATYGSLQRFQDGEIMVNRAEPLTRFYSVFRSAFVDYLVAHPEKGQVTVQNFFVKPATEWRRYRRDAKFYAEYVLSRQINDRIIWGKRTDRDLLKYWKKTGIFTGADNTRRRSPEECMKGTGWCDE